jgi:hypothetical protein
LQSATEPRLALQAVNRTHAKAQLLGDPHNAGASAEAYPDRVFPREELRKGEFVVSVWNQSLKVEYLTPVGWERIMQAIDRELLQYSSSIYEDLSEGPLDLTEVKIAPPAEKIETQEFAAWFAAWGGRR